MPYDDRLASLMDTQDFRAIVDRDLWQRRAGCGPTAAAVILSYLARTRPELAPLYPEGAMDRASFTGLMCRVWEHVTPVSHGLNRPEQMAEGMASFAAATQPLAVIAISRSSRGTVPR